MVEVPAPVVEAPVPEVDGAVSVVENPVPVVEAPVPVAEAPVPMVEPAIPEAEPLVPELEAPVPVVEAPVLEVEAPVPEIEAPAPKVETLVPVAEASVPEVEAPVPPVEAPAVVEAPKSKSFGLPTAEMTEDWMDDDVGCFEDSEDDNEDLHVSNTVAEATRETSENITVKEIIESKCDKNDNYIVSEEIKSPSSSNGDSESLDFCMIQKKTVTVTMDKENSTVTKVTEETSMENGVNGTGDQ